MKKYVILVAGLTAVSAFADTRDAASIGRRLGDGAFMKATGLSPVEWAAQCRSKSAQKAEPYRRHSYSETQRLMPEETPVSTETIQGETGTVASLANTQTSISAGPGTSANYSATANDTTPRAEDSLTDNHNLASGSSANVSTGRDVSNNYKQNHSAIYTDKSDSAAGAPATTDRGVGSSSSLNSSPSGNLAPDSRSSLFGAAWSAQLKSELTAETPDNTGASSFTSASLKNVDITQLNGTIMLKGTVPTEQMKRDLERRVKELSPGSMVNNQLSIAPSADLPANGSSAPRD